MQPGPRLYLIVLILSGLCLRLWNVLVDPALWLDEVFSAQMAQSPFTDLLLAVPRFDTHPPLYYIQLHFWALFGSSDRWLLLNSVLIDTLVILSLWQIGRRLWSEAEGLWIAALYALLPIVVVFAENLRMYALFFLLISWLFYLLECRIRAGASGRARIGTLCLGLAATLSHGLGFFVVFFLYFQALIRLWRGQGFRAALRLVPDYLPVALASLWSLGIGSFRQTEGLEVFDLPTIGLHLTIFFYGMEAPSPTLIGWSGLVLLLLPPLLLPASRGVLFWLVLLPFAVLLLLSLGVKTVFMYRTLGLFAPFLAIALGRFCAGAWARARLRPLLVLLPALLGVAALHSSLSFRKEGYAGAAALWSERAAPDAVLFVEGSINLWGLTRYLPEVPPYSALAIQPPVRDGMLRLKEKLTGTWFERAGLFGKADHLTIGTREIWPWIPEARLAALQSYWVLAPTAGSCLRAGDQELERHAPEGKLLLLCAQPG